ncbi:NUDIX hydrolase [Georgenia subflava]|uniref:NUDIX domain-containing protein n=1 Tax=Georgenia subflava TaxID=1622177 RepID=A0A6N7EI78_9MICO|nr:CoA pyrophosphatase [Georgenia subflava]MPV37839.1 NUDIX domain-containing protein [Georgenia subflava]
MDGSSDAETPADAATSVERGEVTWEGRRAALRALCSRVLEGTARPLVGLNAFDAEVARGFRPSAVLLLFSPPADGGEEPDLFLVQRSWELRHHPGEIALPGGRLEDGEDDVAAALRETHEEIGLHPEHIEVLGRLAPVMVPITRYVVTPVVGWTDRAAAATRVEPGEVLHTIRVNVGTLVDPGTRYTVRIFDRRTAGFRLPDGLVWGLTGNLLDHVLAELGWARPWDRSREVTLRRDPTGRVWLPESD